MAATIDDVLDALKKQVNLTETANVFAAANGVILGHIATAAKAAGSGGGSGGSGAGGGAGGSRQPGDGRGLIGRLWERSRFGQAFGNAEYKFRTTFGKSGPGFEGAMGRGGAALGKAAGAAGVAFAVVGALANMREAIIKFTNEALREAHKLAEVSGPMAAVFANKEFQDMVRDRAKGDATAASTGRLADADSRRKDAQQPLEVTMTNLKNDLLAGLNNGLAEITELLTDGIRGFEKWAGVKILDDVGAGMDPYTKAMVDAAAEGKKLDGRRLADIAEATAARVGRGHISAPAGMRGPGMLP